MNNKSMVKQNAFMRLAGQAKSNFAGVASLLVVSGALGGMVTVSFMTSGEQAVKDKAAVSNWLSSAVTFTPSNKPNVDIKAPIFTFTKN